MIQQLMGAGSLDSPSTNILASKTSPAVFNSYGMSPDAVNKQFGEDFATATGGYAPFAGAGARKGITRLEGEYGKVGETFDVSDTINALEKSRNVNLQVGGQAANNAASKYAEESGPGGSSGIGASMVRAKSLLPFLQGDYAGAAEEGKYRDSAKEKALAAGADIASSLAKLELDYTNSLANYNAQKSNFGMNFAGNKTGLALDASKLQSANAISAAQLAENARQADLSAAIRLRDTSPASTLGALAGAGGGAKRKPLMTSGYIPNSGMIQPATVNGRRLDNQYISPDAIQALGGQLA